MIQSFLINELFWFARFQRGILIFILEMFIIHAVEILIFPELKQNRAIFL
jgi:hypothetical protein